ncbi:MAG: Rieske (2Fe-2S) protein [Solirubrobacteraceae bacterium]
MNGGRIEDQRRRPRPSRLPVAQPALALLPLRLFLGVTFVYAGIQKLSDPGFLTPGAPTYIGTQLTTFAHGTPGGFLLRTFALPDPKLTGVCTALIEILVGLLVVGGLLTRPAAAVGLLLNLILFLTNSWNTHPYFLGSDIVFVFAWVPFVLAGAAGQPALDSALDRLSAARQRRLARTAGRRASVSQEGALTRRALVGRALGATGGLTLALAAIAMLLKGGYRAQASPLSAGAPAPSAGGSGGARAGAGAGTTTSSSVGAGSKAARGARRPPAGAVRIGAANRLPSNSGAIYRDPGSGQPDIVIRHSNGSLSAFSAICTHQGCTVGYEGGQIVCPCHGGTYNAQTGAVEGGPPPSPLARRRVLQLDSELYAFPA